MRLPEKASLEQLRKQAKERVASGKSPSLSTAQHDLARSYGFESWPKLRLHLDQRRLRGLIQDGEPGPVAALLKASPRLAKLPFPEGDTPLHVAAEENRPALVELLAQSGAKLDARYANSAHNALSWALTTWSFAAAEKLVELGLEPDLFCAAGLGRLDLVKAFWKDGKLRPNPSRTGSSRFDESWENRLPCPPESDADKVSDALYIACRADRFPVAEWLLEHGADPNFRGYIGATCLAWAEFSANAELCALLRQCGGSDEIRDYEFQARPPEFPIMVLAGWGFRDRLVKRLQFNPAEVNVVTPAGTPLHAAASHGQEFSVRLLLACGADKSAKNSRGETSAEVASKGGHAALAELLR